MEKIVTTISIDKPSLNELNHIGVKGMHWGHRKAALKEWGREAEKLTRSNFKHPIITGKADRESKNSDTTKNRFRRSLGYQNTKDLKDVNKRVQTMLDNKPKLTPEQKHARTKKVLIAAGAVTVTAALAYGGYKMHKVRVDKVISATKSMPIKQVHMNMPFESTPLGKKVAQNAASNMQRQSTKDLAKEMKSFASSQAALRDQLRNLNR